MDTTTNTTIIYSVIIVVLIGLSAFCSCTETAFSCANTIRLRKWADDGSKKAKRALMIAENFDKALTAILILNNIVNLGCSALATVLCINLFGNYGAAIATGATTLLVLTFGEVIPKCFGKEKCDQIAMSVAGILNALILVLTPLVYLFIWIKKLALKSLHIKGDDPTVTEDELKYIVESIEEQGILEQQESEMVRSVLDFDETTVMEVLTHRVDVVAIDIDADRESILDTIKTHRFSRIPVYEENVDNIVGILHTWNYLEAIADGKEPELRKIITPAQFIFQSQKLSTVLSEFRSKKLHIAVVTDEYGGTMGIVTMEDLLEEIVGEIWDEDEEVETDRQKISDRCWRISGDMELDDFFKLFDIDERELDSDSVTVGGFIFEILDTIPEQGYKFEYHGLSITIDSITDQRIDTATVKILEEPKESEEE